MSADHLILGNVYNIYPQSDLPHMDVYVCLKLWVDFLESKVYNQPLDPNDYIFPSLGSNGRVNRGQPVSKDAVQEMLHSFAADAGIKLGLGRQFSTHCYRRGGAQYRWMMAPVGKRWSLRVVRWWGAWADSEKVSLL
jgi:hypothetical protein